MNRRPEAPIRVLVAAESSAQRTALVALIRSDSWLELVGTAGSGPEAVQETMRLRPAVVAMDICLPQVDGYATARQIMQRCPTPIVLLSAAETGDERAALAAGALAIVRTPGPPPADAGQAHLLTTLRLMAGVPVVTRFASREAAAPHRLAAPTSPPLVLAIAASTGGPGAIQTLLSGLPADFSLPILVVQHIATGFSQALAAWLGQVGGRPTHLVAVSYTHLTLPTILLV